MRFSRFALVATLSFFALSFFALSSLMWDPASAGFVAQAVFANPQAPVTSTPESAIVAAVKRALSGQSDLRKLTVSADGSQVTLPTQQGDDDIRSTLYYRITDDTNFENVPIDRRPPFHIVVDHGVVTLYGWVQGEIEYRKLESIARSTSGVLRVVNNLKTYTK